jgi:fibronectin-binding autotransporter adhesin
MRKRNRIRNLSVCVGGLALTGVVNHAYAQIVVDGSLDAGYGNPLTTQTINTSFGDSNYTAVSGGLPDASGSELDAAYGTVANGNLYLFLAGNIENNGNKINIFIDSGAANGQSTLDISNGSATNMNGSQFSPGFTANFQLDVNDYYGTLYSDRWALTAGTPATDSYLGQIALSSGKGSGTLGGIGFGLNNTNTAGVNGSSGTAATATAADAVNTGLELSIPLSSIGYSSGNIEVLADINNGSDSYLSNQFLPGLPVGTGSLATGVFNFSATSGQYFTVQGPASLPNGNWIEPNSGSWGVATNWSNGYIPGVAGDTANFSGATATSTVTLDGSRTVGTLTFNSSSYSYALISGTGGTLTLNNGSSTAMVTDYAGNHSITAPISLASNAEFSVISSGNTLQISGKVSGNGSVNIYNPGDGVVILSGNNTYSGGTTVTAGNLQLGSSTALPSGSALTLNAQDVPSGNLDLNGNNATVGSITVLTGPDTVPTGAVAQIINTSSVSATSTLTYAGSLVNPSTFNGKITDSGPSGGITALTVASGSLTLTGTDTYLGQTTISTGATLTTSSTAGTAFPSSGSAVNNGSFIVNDTVNAASITGSGTTTVNASGSLTSVTLNQNALVNNGSVTTNGNSVVGPMSGTGTLNIDGGTLQLAHGSGLNSVGSLSIGAGEALDISNDTLIINYGSGADPISSIAAMIQSGYANRTWLGTAAVANIISSTAQTNSGSYGIGYADYNDPGNPAGLSSGQIEITYTLLGDANLDHKVNGSDFILMAANFNDSVTNGWDKGDFNYSNAVNGDDFVLLADNFNDFASQSAVSAADLAALDAFASANGISLASVPEPASLGLLTLGTAAALTRRRRRPARSS